MNMLFADTMRILRSKKGLSQSDVAKRMFVTRATVSRWESGLRLPDVAMITRLSEILGVGVNELLSAAAQSDESPIVIMVDDNPVEWVKYDLEVSKAGLAWLHEITEAAREDYTTFDILKEYYQDEEEDMYWGEAQLELIECIGKQNWLLQQV